MEKIISPLHEVVHQEACGEDTRELTINVLRAEVMGGAKIFVRKVIAQFVIGQSMDIFIGTQSQLSRRIRQVYKPTFLLNRKRFSSVESIRCHLKRCCKRLICYF